MTNELSPSPPLCCPTGGSGDLAPLLLALLLLLAGHAVVRAFKRRIGKSDRRRLRTIAGAALLIMAAGIVFSLRHPSARMMEPPPHAADTSVPTAALQRLVDLGMEKCIPCIMMAPILQELKTSFAGQLRVDLIDVILDPGALDRHQAHTIPTQIFYDAQGQELFRHEGFFAKNDILAQWKKLGFDFQGPPPAR